MLANKTPKKTVVKSCSGDEVKRHLGSLSEDFQHKVSAIGEQFSSIQSDTKEIPPPMMISF